MRKIKHFYLLARFAARRTMTKILFCLLWAFFLAHSLISPQKVKAQRGITIGKTWHYQSGTSLDCSYLQSSCKLYGGAPAPIQISYCEDFGGGVFKWVRVPMCACSNDCYGCPREGYMPPEFVCSIPACFSGWSGDVRPCQLGYKILPTPSATPQPTPTLTPVGCYQSCEKDSNCSGSLKCGYHVNAGRRVCLNSSCASETDCRCSWQ